MSVDGTRVRITPNLAYGVCLVILGSALVLDRLRLIEAGQILRFWPLGLVLLGITLVIQSFQPVVATATTQKRDGFNPGHIVLLAMVGLFASQFFHGGGTLVRADSSNRASILAIMGGYKQVISAQTFRGGEITTVMGEGDLDLRNTSIALEDTPVVEVFTLMGGAVIRVPEGWNVESRVVSIAGGVRDRRTGPRDVPGAPRIIIRGFTFMGGLSIRS
ncbi:MAG TPA: hypothetical protein VJM31_16990 [Vicinamibacterales bacterium]|nr:hypothetical protein [Vicinamibacterales bacterium]